MFGGFINKYKLIINKVDCVVILLIVFNLFVDLMYVGVWLKYLWEIIVVVVVMSGVLLFVVLGVMMWLLWCVGFNLVDEIIVVFCGLKKSLVNGVLMVKILFVGNFVFGFIVLLLMIYY